jgi:hypothetical protein
MMDAIMLNRTVPYGSTFFRLASLDIASFLWLANHPKQDVTHFSKILAVRLVLGEEDFELGLGG